MNGVELSLLSQDLHHKAHQLEQEREDLHALLLGFQLRMIADDVSNYSKAKLAAETYRGEPREGDGR